jgi:hypothetical protein
VSVGVLGVAWQGRQPSGSRVADEGADDEAGRLLTERQRRLSWWAEGGGKQCLCRSGEVQSRQMRRAIKQQRASGEVQGRRLWSVRAGSTRRRAVGIVRSEGDRPRSGRVTSAGAGHDLWAMDKERGWCSARAEVSCFASWPATGCCDDDASQIYTPRHCDVMLWREMGEERWRGEETTASWVACWFLCR